MPIQSIHARQIWDSRGNPTVEVDLTTEKGVFTAAVPSGASTGVHEAVELRDGDKSKYLGKGVTKAVANVNDVIAPKLIAANIDIVDQEAVDNFLIELDGTANKGKLGANAILGVSMAVAKAAAAQKGVPLYAHFADLAGIKPPFILPVPAMNVINGGSHAGNALAFQEFMLLPTGAADFEEAMQMGTETYHTLKSVIKKKYGIDATNVGDEGGFAPNVQGAEESLDLLTEAISKAGYTGKVQIGLDVASSEFYKDGKYDLDFKNPNSDASKWLTGKELAEVYHSLVQKYDIVSIEDAFDQDDVAAWVEFNATNGIQLVGDDLTVTNPERVKMAGERRACNGLLLKVNQIGTITESIKATTIADLVVGLGVGQIKTGAPCRSERVAKNTKIQIVGDDLTVTNPKRIQTAIEKKSCNGLLLKVNQIGTITESIKATQLASSDGWGTMVSHRSGETEDTTIADLVVGLGTGQIKTGAPCRSERVAKYNRLIRIADEIKQAGGSVRYAGSDGLSRGPNPAPLAKKQ
ncbi:hypothetical protein JCM3770_002990 [Rhodotorula araucariae]